GARLTPRNRRPPRPPQKAGVTSLEAAVTRRRCPKRSRNVGRTAACGPEPPQHSHWKNTSAFAPGTSTRASGQVGPVVILRSCVGSCLPRQAILICRRRVGSEQAVVLTF